MMIPDSHQDLLADETRAFAFLGTTMKSGSPQVTPVWFSFDGQHIWINTAAGRVKDRNLRERPEVAVTIVDPKNPYRYMQIRGRVVKYTEEGGREHINALNQKYHGNPNYGGPKDETRVIFMIEPLKINTMG